MNHSSRPDNALFIHAVVDDAMLSAAQFRVLCHVSRRGECYACVRRMAKTCRLHADTVRKALKELVKLGWLSPPTYRTGQTTVYTVNHSKIREYPYGKLERGDMDNEGGGVYEIEGVKVYPNKISPKEIRSSKEGKEGENISDTEAQRIYDTYPRKQNKLSALKAIKKSMVENDPEFLLERTQLFAEVAARSRNQQFIKFPAKWFDEECFNEDPKDWAKSLDSTWGDVNRDALGREIKKWS